MSLKAYTGLSTDGLIEIHNGSILSTVRRIIGNLRATIIGRSFGNQKQHYGVGRIAARNNYSETLLLFFRYSYSKCRHIGYPTTRRRAQSERKEASLTEIQQNSPSANLRRTLRLAPALLRPRTPQAAPFSAHFSEAFS